jgi:peptidoglycan/LPS O-acetylase OafA/YrhL
VQISGESNATRPEQAMPANLKPLTALRFFAAAWVVAFLYWPDLSRAGAPSVVAKGYLGVELFFVLSGFILSHVYLAGFGAGRFHYGRFLWARLARIYPMHLATLAGVGLLVVAATLAGFALEHPIAVMAALPANLTLIHAWGLSPMSAWNHPSWSLSAEWFAYLTFPAFAGLAWRLRERPLAAAAGAVAFLFGLYAAFQALAGFSLTQATYLWGALRIVPCFAYGCAAYLVWRSDLVKSRTLATAGVAVSVTLALASAAAGLPDGCTVVWFGLLVLSLAALSSTGSRLFSNPVLVYLGEVSFAVYMVCIPWELVFVNGAQKILGLGDAPLPLPVWLAFAAGVVPVAAAAHHLVERPAREVMRRWSDSGFQLPVPIRLRRDETSRKVA